MSDTDKDPKETLPEDERHSPPEEQQEPTGDGAAEEMQETASEDATAEQPAGAPAAAEGSGAAPAAVAKPARKRGGGIAWLAILLSIVALGAAGYTFYEDWRAADDDGTARQLAAIEDEVSATRESLSELRAGVDAIQLGSGGTAVEIDALRQEIEESARLARSLPARISALESAVASFAGISTGARDTWLLAEAEYYMQIANAQLQLANNPTLASLALQMADERIVQLANPALTDVRRTLADELAALDVMKKPDIEGATLTLASLARVVESLPLAGVAETAEQPESPDDANLSGLERAWLSVKSAMAGLVKVTPPDEERPRVVTPDTEQFLRSNLALQLQSARLALLRGEQAVFEQTIDDARALLGEYFDVDSAQVASTLDTLAEIRASVFTTTAPDISGSLRLLRQFRTLSESPQ